MPWAGRSGGLLFCLLLVLYSAPRGFSPGPPVFPSPLKSIFPNSNSILECTGISNEFLLTPGAPWVSKLQLQLQITMTITITNYNYNYKLQKGRGFSSEIVYITTPKRYQDFFMGVASNSFTPKRHQF